MSSILENYWQRVFDPHRCGPRSFKLPNLSDPLMSANFAPHQLKQHGHWNRISNDLDSDSLFKLGVLKSDISTELTSTATIKKLSTVANETNYKNLIRVGFACDSKYLERITFHLSNSKYEHFNIALQKDGDLIAMLNIGLCYESALMFNCVVAPKHRKNGHTKELINQAKLLATNHGAKQLFFWTRHSKLIDFADLKFNYNIIRHDAQTSS